jgi:hypothetical protein
MILLEQLTSTQYAWAQLLSTVGAGIILFGLIGISILVSKAYNRLYWWLYDRKMRRITDTLDYLFYGKELLWFSGVCLFLLIGLIIVAGFVG